MLVCSGLLVIVTPGSASAASASVTCAPVTGTPVEHPPRDSYTPITPQRLVDTRDGIGGVSGEVGAGCTLVLDLTDSPVPDDAEAVALSVTAIAPQRGFVTVFACDEGQPATSNLNTRAGFPTPNLVAAAIDADHRVCLYSLFPSHLVVDLAGWWSDGPDRYTPVAPARAYDTRQLPGGARLPAGEVRSIPLAGGLVPEDATSAMVNLTVIDGASPGYLVAFPCGTPAPLASNLNFLAGEARAVAAIVGLGAAGDVCVMSNVDVHVIVDVTGAYAPAPAFGPAPALHSLVGHRVADTRTPDDPWTTPFSPGETRRLDPLAATPFAGRGGAVVLNVVATNITRPGFVSMFPCGGPTPLVSSLNLMPGGEATNLVPVELGPTGELCVLASQAIDLVIDLFGVMGPADDSLAERLSFPGRTVFPDYSPDGTDYAVVCDAGPTQLTISVDPLPNVSLTVNGAPHGAGDVELTVPAEGLTTVELRTGIDSDTHHFRCVPPDFPVLDVTRTGDTAPGWYFTTLSQGIPLAPFLVILDERGAPVWFKRADQDTLDFKRLSDGRFAYTTALGPRFGIDTEHGYRITNLQGELLDEHLTEDPEMFPVDHHDYVELPGGGWALLTYPLVPMQDLDVLDGVLGQEFHEDDSIVDGVIQEMNASGEVVWDWATMDHFEYEEVTFPQRFALYPNEPNGGEVDVWHLNSLHRVADGTGDFVVSARHLDAIFRVDRATENVDWILGGNAAVDRPERLEIVGDPLGGPRRPHDARLNGDVLTLFDNRAGTAGPARAVAYRIDDDPGDMTATLLWEIREPGGRPSLGLGSARAAGDGSVLVDWGALQPMFQEFAPDGTPLMTIGYSGNPPYRIVKYPKSLLSAAQLRANAGGMAEAPT
jgi:hypothetical protein